MPPPSSTALREILAGAGYEVVFRSGGLVECFVHRGEERWIGRGDTEDSALEDVIGRMLPSHAARMLLDRMSSPRAVAEAPVPSVPPPTKPAPRAPPPRLPGVPATKEAGVGALDALLAEIEAQLSVFARMAPDRQRTYMLLWICRARRVEEAFPGEHEMERRASACARRLSDLAKMFWPGSVRALQLGARPGDVPELRLRGAPSPRTWAEAALIAERLLDDHIAESKREGLDAEGWCQAQAEPPIKANAEKVFAEAIAALDAADSLPRSGKSVMADGPALDKLLVAAKKLRFARGRVRDSVAWGAAVGRLRKLLPTLKAGSARIREAIDPKARPEPW